MNRPTRPDAGPAEPLLTSDRICELCDSYPDGLHDLAAPATVLDAELPRALAEVYRTFDGATFFHEDMVLLPSSAARRVDGRWQIGTLQGELVGIDEKGAVWVCEADSEEWIQEGSRVDRWLFGVLERLAGLYDNEGEFLEDAFDEDGELTDEAYERGLRAILKRDKEAPATRWRLARLLVARQELGKARDELEQVVETAPTFSWAWYDLGRISEALDELENAQDELVAAADARADYEHNAFFLSHAARIAARRGREAERAQLSARALALIPDFVSMQREGARTLLAEDDLHGARELVSVALALAPRDLECLDLQRQLQAAAN